MTGVDPGSSRDSLLSEIFTLSTTFSSEALSLAANKAVELGFDVNRGVVPLQESLINLNTSTSVLQDAIEKQKLVQLPISVQKEVLANLEAIARFVKGLSDGADEIINLTGAIETLNTTIWKYGLHNLSDQVLGYQKKLNQIKQQEVRVDQLMRALQEAQKVAEGIRTSAAKVESIREMSERLAPTVDEVQKAANQTSAVIQTILQNEKQSGELLAGIKTSNNELTSLDQSIRKFYGEVENYRQAIAQFGTDASSRLSNVESSLASALSDWGSTSKATIDELRKTAAASEESLTTEIETRITKATDDLEAARTQLSTEIETLKSTSSTKVDEAIRQASVQTTEAIRVFSEKADALQNTFHERAEQTVEANDKATKILVEELAGLKDQVREQIQQATGFTLFGAFQARQNQIVSAKEFWSRAIALLLLVSVGLTAWIAYEAKTYEATNLAFWVKLSMTIPVGFAITFCALQYGRERRLEEEYAFKASISVSLNPYRDLVLAILSKEGVVDQGKYTEFVIDSVKNVFTSPTERVFEGQKKESGLTTKTFKQAAEVIGAGMKAAK